MKPSRSTTPATAASGRRCTRTTTTTSGRLTELLDYQDILLHRHRGQRCLLRLQGRRPRHQPAHRSVQRSPTSPRPIRRPWRGQLLDFGHLHGLPDVSAPRSIARPRGRWSLISDDGESSPAPVAVEMPIDLHRQYPDRGRRLGGERAQVKMVRRIWSAATSSMRSRLATSSGEPRAVRRARRARPWGCRTPRSRRSSLPASTVLLQTGPNQGVDEGALLGGSGQRRSPPDTWADRPSRRTRRSTHTVSAGSSCRGRCGGGVRAGDVVHEQPRHLERHHRARRVALSLDLRSSSFGLCEARVAAGRIAAGETDVEVDAGSTRRTGFRRRCVQRHVAGACRSRRPCSRSSRRRTSGCCCR